ncbi:MAG TPA: hypothetical protein VHD33_05995 [Legionellaceae bacterium]|nr:hypothetical protein [Legionellaceae bacterium]
MKKLAIIHFGGTPDVIEASERMKTAKESVDYQVQIINILDPSEADLAFLQDEQLHQINVMGHSASWDELGRPIPIANRSIDDASLFQAAQTLRVLAETTNAIEFRLYPCEMADKIDDNGLEIRAYEATDKVIHNEPRMVLPQQNPNLEAYIARNITKDPGQVSSLDVMRVAIIEGKNQHVDKHPGLTINIGGQVGPGYHPSHEMGDPGSPRSAVSRETVRNLQKLKRKAKQNTAAIEQCQRQLDEEERTSIAWSTHPVTYLSSSNKSYRSDIKERLARLKASDDPIKKVPVQTPMTTSQHDHTITSAKDKPSNDEEDSHSFGV